MPLHGHLHSTAAAVVEVVEDNPLAAEAVEDSPWVVGAVEDSPLPAAVDNPCLVEPLVVAAVDRDCIAAAVAAHDMVAAVVNLQEEEGATLLKVVGVLPEVVAILALSQWRRRTDQWELGES